MRGFRKSPNPDFSFWRWTNGGPDQGSNWCWRAMDFKWFKFSHFTCPIIVYLRMATIRTGEKEYWILPSPPAIWCWARHFMLWWSFGFSRKWRTMSSVEVAIKAYQTGCSLYRGWHYILHSREQTIKDLIVFTFEEFHEDFRVEHTHTDNTKTNTSWSQTQHTNFMRKGMKMITHVV